MRLQLILILSLVGAGCGGTSSPRHVVSSTLQVYSDDHIFVVSPSLSDTVTLGEDTTITGSYVADALTGATQLVTTDAVSSATNFEESRQSVALAATHQVSEHHAVTGSYEMSLEDDYWAHSPGISFRTDAILSAVVASIGYHANIESAGRTDDPSFDERSTSHQVDLTWTQILDASTSLSILVTGFGAWCDARIGCRANPYRFVGISRASGVVAIRERHPDTHWGGAGALRLARALSDYWAVHLGYRWFRDSWRIDGHTADAALAGQLSKRLLARLEVRGVVQSEAEFYQAAYPGEGTRIPEFRTADAELSKLWNVTATLRGEWDVGELGADTTRLTFRLGRMWMHYPGYPSNPKRTALILSFGVDSAF